MAAESLAGKVAIVSGSSKGIGAATCVELASRQVFDLPRVRNNKDERLLTLLRGAIVVVNYPWPSERQEAEAVLARICETKSSSASKCILVESDLSTTTGPQHLVEETIRQLGPAIDILINNAGVAIMKPACGGDPRSVGHHGQPQCSWCSSPNTSRVAVPFESQQDCQFEQCWCETRL
jgi:NAD(P)-dependent dehydrogenase (short-subunit alcohol dehydrogenase family)